jgi:hypothetical protein
MRPDERALGALALLALAACAGQGASNIVRPAPPPVRADNGDEREAAAALVLTRTIQTLQGLVSGSPTQQAEILADARSAYERAPLGSGQLRYALVLATPGHPATDPAQAQKLLRELAAQPEALMPAERALTLVELAQLNRESDVRAEGARLDDAQRSEHEHVIAAQKRLQAELDDNAKLRKQLEDAQAKLDEIANLERNMIDRKSGKETRKP